MESVNSASVIVEDQNYNPKSLAQVPEKGNKNLFTKNMLQFLFTVVIFLRATGNAPILKQNKFKVSSAQKFLSIQEFVRKQLLLQEKDPLVK